MRLSGISLAALLLTLTPTMAQQPATIDGWDGIQFGMTSAEVLAAQPGMTWQGSEGSDTCTSDPKAWRSPFCVLRRDQPVVIVGATFGVAVWLDASGRVNRIRLAFDDRPSPRTKDQCLAVTERARSAIVGRFGAMGDNYHTMPDHLSYSRRVGLTSALAAKLAAPPSITARIGIEGRYQDFDAVAKIMRKITTDFVPETLERARKMSPICAAEVSYNVDLPEILQADTGKF